MSKKVNSLKKAKNYFLFFFIIGFSSGSFNKAFGLIDFVQLIENTTATNSNSISTGTFSASTGNLIVCSVIYANTTVSISSITDTSTNTYLRAVGPINGVGDMNGWRHEVWYAYNITGNASLNVTANFSSTFLASKMVVCHEYSGALTSSDPKDVAVSATGTSGNAQWVP